jgi:hypothetical protein
VSAPSRDESAHYELMRFLMGKEWADRDLSRRAELMISGLASRAKALETYATLSKGPWKPPR